ncbi:MAG TPA: hypothetical protein VER55_06590, partial [Ardenticatenaceae bacterium]|nr:hypothetical protein [Ardenticatenaceae bacterium]
LLDRNFARAWLYETDIVMLLDVSDVLDSDLLPPLAQHVAPGDLAELSQILQDQRQRRRFQP